MDGEQSDKQAPEVNWEERYAATGGAYFFGEEPSLLGRLAVRYWRVCHADRPARVLDLGCGEGRDSVFFAQQGWSVVAVDSSRTAIERACALAADRGVALEAAICEDMRSCWHRGRRGGAIPPVEEFDLVFAGCSLGSLGDETPEFLAYLRRASRPGALHAIRSATREAWGLVGRPEFYRFNHNELRLAYRAWRLLYYGEDVLYVPHMDRLGSFADIIAQKPG